MVLSAARYHRVFLERAQAWQGLARIGHGGAGTLNELHRFRRFRCNAGEMLQEVERGALPL